LFFSFIYLYLFFDFLWHGQVDKAVDNTDPPTS